MKDTNFLRGRLLTSPSVSIETEIFGFQVKGSERTSIVPLYTEVQELVYIDPVYHTSTYM